MQYSQRLLKSVEREIIQRSLLKKRFNSKFKALPRAMFDKYKTTTLDDLLDDKKVSIVVHAKNLGFRGEGIYVTKETRIRRSLDIQCCDYLNLLLCFDKYFEEMVQTTINKKLGIKQRNDEYMYYEYLSQ